MKSLLIFLFEPAKNSKHFLQFASEHTILYSNCLIYPDLFGGAYFMSFKFRRRGDVSEQSPQQEPFFQNTAGQQPYVDSAGYPQMGQPQGYDPRFNGGFGPQNQPYPQQPYGMNPGVPAQQQTQPFFHGNSENFYSPQQPGMQGNMQQPMLNPSTNQPYGMVPPQMHPQAPNGYMHPVQASQLGNFQGHPPQAAQGQQAPSSSYAPEDVRSLSFWQETQANSGFEDPDSESESNSPIRLLVAVAGVALIAGLSWFAYKWAKSPSSDTPPLIHADHGPHKVSPDHRGGLNIPYQDKLIYDRIGDGNTEEPAERLLPPPEMPSMVTSTPVDQNQQNSTQQPMYGDVSAAQPNMQQNVMPGAPQQQSNLQQPVNMQPQQPVAVAPSPIVPAPVLAQPQTEEIEPEVITKTKPVAMLKGNYFVQLATVKSEESALREWKRLQAKHNLKGMKSQIKETETTDGDIVFRLLVGPFEEKIKAQKYAVKIDGTKVVHITE